jgi:hypothetical protein
MTPDTHDQPISNAVPETERRCRLAPCSASGVTVHVVEHPRGALMRIGHDGGSIVLDRDEALELYALMQVHLGTMPSKP